MPTAPGVYGWWFRVLPTAIEVTQCVAHGRARAALHGHQSEAAADERARAELAVDVLKRAGALRRQRGSLDLRKTLGCLLAAELGIALRRVGSGKRMTFGLGEQVLSASMGAHVPVSRLVHPQQWEPERELIASLVARRAAQPPRQRAQRLPPDTVQGAGRRGPTGASVAGAGEPGRGGE